MDQSDVERPTASLQLLIVMHGPRHYRSVVWAVPVILIVYLSIAVANPVLVRIVPGYSFSGEIFPFFTWYLFSKSRRQAGRYTVRIVAVQGPEAQGAPLVGRTLTDTRSVAFLGDIRFQKTAQALARAHRLRRDGDAESLQTMLDNFLRPYGVIEYELIRLEYDVLAYYRGEEVGSVTVIARFRLEAG